jgi:hypothetical protein
VVGPSGSSGLAGGRAKPLRCSRFVVLGWSFRSGEVGEGLGLEAPPTLTLPLGWFTDGVPLGRGPALARSHPSGLGPQAALRYLASGAPFFGINQKNKKKEKSHGMATCTGAEALFAQHDLVYVLPLPPRPYLIPTVVVRGLGGTCWQP